MKVHKMHLAGFKSVEDLLLDFDNINGFWEVEGVVGSGKTTLGEAILFALFGSVRDKSNSDLVKWGQKKSYVEIWCESKGKQLYIKRHNNLAGQSPIEVTVDGEPITFTNKRDVQHQLEDEYYDISKLMLETLCIISFNGFQSLSTMNTRATKEFLDEAFGFSVISDYAAGCVDARRGDNSKLSSATTDIVSLERQIKAFEEWKMKGDTTVDPDELSALQVTKADVIKHRDQLSSDYLKRRRDMNSEVTKLRNELADIKAQGMVVKKNIDFISKGICPTCGAPLDQSHLEEHQKERAELGIRYKEVQKKLDEAVQQYNDNEKAMTDAINPLNLKIQEYEMQERRYNDILRQQRQFDIEISKYRDQLKDAVEHRDKIQGDIDEWDELQRIFLKDIKDKILSSLIPSINTYIESYIAELHLPYIVEFDESFSCHIQVTNVDNSISVKSLSTGQLKTVDMIIILSVLKVLLSNVSFNLVFLDELLSNMDAELRDTMCEMLKKNISGDQKVFIISHAPLNPEILDGRIHVDYKNGTSEYIFNNL